MLQPAYAGSPEVPSPPWNGKGPNACKDEPIPISASSFSRLSHSILSAPSTTLLSSPLSLSLVSSPHSCARNFFLYLSSFAFLSRSPSARFTTLTAESLSSGIG